MSSKKVILVGAQGVGKTDLAFYLLTGELTKTYFSTLGVEVHPINIDGHEYTFWDTGSIFSGLTDGYYLNADLCIIIIDPGIKISYDQYFRSFKNDVQAVSPNCKFINVINKIEDFNVNYTDAIHISLRQGWGITQLKHEINQK